MEDEFLFKELDTFEELQSPFLLFPVLHRELESLNRLKRNREKSILVSSVLSGLHFIEKGPGPEERLDLSGKRLGKSLDDSRVEFLSETFFVVPKAIIVFP